VLVEEFDQLREIRKRAGETVHLVNHDDVDLTRAHVCEQLLEDRAVERGSRKRPVVIPVVDQAPALVCLALDVGLAGLTLGVERIELEVEVMVGRFPGIDRRAKALLNRRAHGLASWRGCLLKRCAPRTRRRGGTFGFWSSG
jgi:hypothetical protein